jgi:hypothetical protein
MTIPRIKIEVKATIDTIKPMVDGLIASSDLAVESDPDVLLPSGGSVIVMILPLRINCVDDVLQRLDSFYGGTGVPVRRGGGRPRGMALVTRMLTSNELAWGPTPSPECRFLFLSKNAHRTGKRLHRWFGSDPLGWLRPLLLWQARILRPGPLN